MLLKYLLAANWPHVELIAVVCEGQEATCFVHEPQALKHDATNAAVFLEFTECLQQWALYTSGDNFDDNYEIMVAYACNSLGFDATIDNMHVELGFL